MDALAPGVLQDGTVSCRATRRRSPASSGGARRSGRPRALWRGRRGPTRRHAPRRSAVFTGLGEGQGRSSSRNPAPRRGRRGARAAGPASSAVVSAGDTADRSRPWPRGVPPGVRVHHRQDPHPQGQGGPGVAAASVPRTSPRPRSPPSSLPATWPARWRPTCTLVDLSPDTATPEFVADVATTAAKGTKVRWRCWPGADPRRLRWSCSRGSGLQRSPALSRSRVVPGARQEARVPGGQGHHVRLGGLSLKPPASMMTMKSDMAGAAAAPAPCRGGPRTSAGRDRLAAPRGEPALGLGHPPWRRPAHARGHTVEVLTRTPEGRLVLADGLRCRPGEPAALVDIATLTGAHTAARRPHRRCSWVTTPPAPSWSTPPVARASPRGPRPLPGTRAPPPDSSFRGGPEEDGDKHGGMLVAGLFRRRAGAGVDAAPGPTSTSPDRPSTSPSRGATPPGRGRASACARCSSSC
ncbi:hypothetical protein QJS66_05060 [Kocuria rhizophila]|nr:hypothetical protein QJS66_05060 [Kocuria rhizophila]